MAYDLDRLFRDYKQKIYRLALSVSRNEKDAEDILQNTFIKVMENVDRFRAESQLSTWIYKIAYNEALMLLRKKRRQFQMLDVLDYEQKAVPAAGFTINWPEFADKKLLNDEIKNRLDAAIRNIPLKYRLPLLLQRVEGQSLKTMTQITGLKMNSLKTRLHRANLFVREQLQAERDPALPPAPPADAVCSIVLEFVYDFAEGRLSEKYRAQFQAHIQECAQCRQFLDTYLQAIKITKALRCGDLPEALQHKIETFLSSQKP